MEKLHKASVKSARTFYGELPSHQRICGGKANLNVHGDLGYDDVKLFNTKKSATSGIMGKRLGKLKNDDDYVLRRTMEDSIRGTVTLEDEKLNVLDLQPDVG